MLVTKTHYDIPTKLDANGRPIRIFVISPVVRGYPNAKFPGTDRGNKYKVSDLIHCSSIYSDHSLHQIEKEVAAYDEAAFDRRVLASFCFFATDIHSATLGKGKTDNSLARVRAGELTNNGEVVMIFGKQDTHVPREGRDIIRKTLEDADVTATVRSTTMPTFIEVQAQHAFVRDEQSKGRWDAALTRSIFGFMMEVFERTVGRDLGERVDDGSKIEHILRAALGERAQVLGAKWCKWLNHTAYGAGVSTVFQVASSGGAVPTSVSMSLAIQFKSTHGMM
ncbi:hypothetical protein TRAPUB_10528 [Trametes pubescens]|uniref:Uncharacterized protein n=1 Tax=Trametes pubescens TaxID=154538 RepID=A0A1M2VZJ9_TRAPU|nr:hypothetical protein TRAPUB_10528 [Trametes pubescens]